MKLLFQQWGDHVIKLASNCARVDVSSHSKFQSIRKKEVVSQAEH